MSEQKKRTAYTDELNENLLQMLEQKPAKPVRTGDKRRKDDRRSSSGSRHASERKKRAARQNRRFFLMSIGIAIGVLVAAGALIYVSLLFLY